MAEGKAIKLFGAWLVPITWDAAPSTIQLAEKKGAKSEARIMLASVRTATRLEIAQAEGMK